MIWEKGKKILPMVIVLSGVGLIASGIFADYIFSGRQSGFGVKQIALVLFGIAISGYGIFLASPFGRRFVSRYHLSSIKRLNILLLLLSLSLPLASVEVLLRMTHQYNPPGYPPKCIRAQVICDLYEPYAPFGYRLKPSRQEEYFYPYFNPNRRRLSMNSNEYGFRSSHAFDDIGEWLRIAVLGDSQVFGEGVEESERFTNLLETDNPGWRVYNLAMPGFGPDLMLMTLEDVGVNLKPSVVVFVYFADDFSRVYPYYTGNGFKIPHFTVRSGKLVRIPYPEFHVWDHLHLTWVVRNAYWQFSDAERKLNNAILDSFLTSANQYSFEPVIVFLPYDFETQEKKLRAEEDRIWLRDYSVQNEVPFLDLTDAIDTAGWKQVLIENNPHFNPKGHEIIASELNQFLNEQVFK